jgi:hypothetical protein
MYSKTGWDRVTNRSQLVLYMTGLNRLGYSHQTDRDRLLAVRSGCTKKRLRSQPVAVAVAPHWGSKTGPNRTLKH